MQKMSAQALRMAVINAAATDEAFRTELTSDPRKAIKARFGDQTLNLRVHLEKPGEFSFLIPAQTERLGRALEHVAADLKESKRGPTRGEFESLVVLKAWKDAAFRAGLRTDARSAINGALREYSASLPTETAVRVYEEKPGECVIVVPPPIGEAEELSESELEAVAGGEGPAIIVVTIVGSVAAGVSGAIATKIVDKIWTSAEGSEQELR